MLVVIRVKALIWVANYVHGTEKLLGYLQLMFIFSNHISHCRVTRPYQRQRIKIKINGGDLGLLHHSVELGWEYRDKECTESTLCRIQL